MLRAAAYLLLSAMPFIPLSAFATQPRVRIQNQAQQQSTGSSSTSSDDKLSEIKKAIDELDKSVAEQTNQIKDLRNDRSKYWLTFIGGGIGFFGSFVGALLSGFFAFKNSRLVSDLASNVKTTELLFNQIAGFTSGSQPRASALSSISAYYESYPELHPLFRVFIVSQLVHLITNGDNSPLEESNALLMLELAPKLNILHDEKTTIYKIWKAKPVSSKGLKMNSTAETILKGWQPEAMASTPSRPTTEAHTNGEPVTTHDDGPSPSS